MSDTGLMQPDASADAGFAEPWQAQAFAITMQLSKRGAFTWTDWVEVFSTEIRAHPARFGEDDTDAYYRQWLAALETILTRRGLSTTDEISSVQDLWRQAYVNTPHGLPVALANATTDHDAGNRHHDHGADHGHHHCIVGVREPVAVSPATLPS